MGGPCSGHLLVSHVPLMVESPVGQLNSLPLVSQTGAKFPGKEDVFKKNARGHSSKIAKLKKYLSVQASLHTSKCPYELQ